MTSEMTNGCTKKTTMITWILMVYCLLGTALCKKCLRESVTVASGTRATQGPYCSGELIFADEFDVLDFKTWQHEITAAGGGNWEFNYYLNNRSNSYTVDGSLWIRPTLTSDTYGEKFLTSGTLNLNNGAPADQCTNALYWGCERTGTPTNIVNPIQSARLRTVNSFSFKYGTVHVRAKMPTGDWLWPAIWMMPRDNAYGTWPASGEIDITENRGNTQLYENGVNIGVEQTGGTLHFGPHAGLNGYNYAHYLKNAPPGRGFNLDYHVYKVIWTPDNITFLVDDELIGTVTPKTNFWDLGQFETREPGTENPWRYGTKMAPFDQEFYIILNLAVGGTNFFPDDATNPHAKPWLNTSPTAATDFWNARSNWLPTWNLSDNTTASLAIDYVRVWAL